MTQLIVVRAATPDEALQTLNTYLEENDLKELRCVICLPSEFDRLLGDYVPGEPVEGKSLTAAAMEALKASDNIEAVAVFFPNTFSGMSSEVIIDAYNTLADVFIGNKFTVDEPLSDPSIIKCSDHSQLFRAITSHNLSGLETGIRISAPSAKDAGPSNSLYLLSGFNMEGHPSFAPLADVLFEENMQGVVFLKGFNNGVPDGITMEALTAILIDRLEVFQSGPFACDENARALSHYQLALTNLHDRTVRLAKEREENAAKDTSEGEAASV